MRKTYENSIKYIYIILLYMDISMKFKDKYKHYNILNISFNLYVYNLTQIKI